MYTFLYRFSGIVLLLLSLSLAIGAEQAGDAPLEIEKLPPPGGNVLLLPYFLMVISGIVVCGYEIRYIITGVSFKKGRNVFLCSFLPFLIGGANTVYMMIEAFGKVAANKDASPADLASGISVALVSLLFGVAISMISALLGALMMIRAQKKLQLSAVHGEGEDE